MFLKIVAQAFEAGDFLRQIFLKKKCVEAGDFLIKLFLIKKCVLLLVYCCIYTVKVHNCSKETIL